MKTIANIIDLLLSFAKSTGVQFVGIRGYENQSGEVADVVLNVGADFSKAKAKDIEYLKNLDVKTLKSAFGVAILEQARQALIGSLISPAKAQSEAQKNAYTVITNGLKVHNTTGEVYVYGLFISKKVTKKGEYKTVNSSDLTLAKKELQKDMKSTQFRQYIVKNIDTMKMNGTTLEF